VEDPVPVTKARPGMPPPDSHSYSIGAAFILDGRRYPTLVTIIPMMPPRPPLSVVKLSDHFGQYVLTLKCECGHTRIAQPQTLAALAGWDALLVDVLRRLRCSHCGRRQCSATVRPEIKRDG
jgi:hypothetical protein